MEKEVDRYEDEVHGFESSSRDDCIDIARHFAEWQKEQMMKGAAEGVITYDNRGNNVIRAGEFNKDFEYGDKVKIIIIKEDAK